MNPPGEDGLYTAVEIKKLRSEMSGLRRQLRYEVQRVEQWRRRYGALQDRLRELEKDTRR